MLTDKLLDTVEASNYLKEKGCPISPNTFAKLACIGGGPKYRKFGRRRRYYPSDLDEYAQSKLSPLLSSTSEAL